MSYCVECGVELDESAKKCVLCSTPVINPNKNLENSPKTPFSRKEEDLPVGVKKRFFCLLATTIIAIPQIVCVLANAFVYKNSFWSLHVVGALCLLWVLFVFPFLTKKPYPFLMWGFDTVAVGVYLYLFFSLLEFPADYYFKGALPITLINSALVLGFMLWNRANKRHWVLKILFVTCLIAVGALTVGAVLSFLCGVRLAFEIGTIVFASLLAIVVFLSHCYKSETIRKWLSKRIFV